MIHSRFRFAGVALFAGALFALGSSPASATSMVLLTPEQMTDASDYIVRGTVGPITVDADADGQMWTHVRIAVRTVVKGPADLDVLVLDVMGGIGPDRTTIVDGVPRFDTGEDVLVFAEKLNSGLLVPTGLRQGKFTVRIDPDNGRELLVNFAPSLTVRYDSRFIPNPPYAERVYLDDYTDRIEERMHAGWDGKPIPGKSLDRLHMMHESERAQENAR